MYHLMEKKGIKAEVKKDISDWQTCNFWCAKRLYGGNTVILLNIRTTEKFAVIILKGFSEE